MTFYTATDGNHGRGVAWTANRLKQKSVVYMPKGSSEVRLQAIKNEGSIASITDMNYDDAVRLAAADAKKNNGLIVQDTAWEGYEEIPTWIMQGYGTMALEAIEQLKEYGVDEPTHVSAPDWVAANGMRILGNPLKDDTKVISGESGAVTTGLVYEIMTNPEYKQLKADLKLNSDSKILVFSTEGDTDPETYRKIVWKGGSEK